jgi:hypothetical protein
MRPTTRLPMTRLAAVLLALSLSWLVAGCGDDSDSSSSDDSSESSESESTDGAETTEPSESESDSAEEPSEDAGPGDASVEQFIEGCKQGVDQQITAGTVPEDLRADLEAVCDSATGPEDADRIALETCVVVATGTPGSGLSEDEARTACEEQLG